MALYNCAGKETGKIKGYVASPQLLLDCSGESCKAKFGLHSFTAKRAKDGTYYSFAPDYFEFDPVTGAAQGVSGEPFYYFTGTCKKS